MNDVRCKLAPPWITFVNQVTALFGNDPEIKIEYDNDEVALRLYVDNPDKAMALDYLLPVEKEFGNVILEIEIIPANGELEEEEDILISAKELFDMAFENNPVYAFSKEITGIFNVTLTYVVFKNKVVQFFNDNLNDIHGLTSTLYQEIAKDLFDEAGLYNVYYNTDIEEKVFGMPLGEWP